MAAEEYKVLYKNQDRETGSSGGFSKLLNPTDLCAFDVLYLWGD